MSLLAVPMAFGDQAVLFRSLPSPPFAPPPPPPRPSRPLRCNSMLHGALTSILLHHDAFILLYRANMQHSFLMVLWGDCMLCCAHLPHGDLKSFAAAATAIIKIVRTSSWYFFW